MTLPQSIVTPNDTDRIHTETQLLNQKLDFSACYMAIQYLITQIESFPEAITDQTIDALVLLIESNRFNSQKQVLFLYTQAALALIHMAQRCWIPVTGRIIPRLQKILISSKGKRQRAVATALGKLPVQLEPHPFPSVHLPLPLEISLELLFSCFKEIDPLSVRWQGRSLIAQTRDNGMGIIKFARTEANISQLFNEVLWMDFLQIHPPCPSAKFHIPCPVRIENQCLFNIIPSPGSPFSDDLLKNTPSNLQSIAIAYHAHAQYFEYPNEKIAGKKTSIHRIKEIFFRNALLLGNLTSKGIIHTALIPLFHNRVQQGRRNDNGAYLWEHGGRLDQWLDSCRYPNFASSGLRDFEHLVEIKDSRPLGHYIGEHILSFILVIGSYFRNKAPSKKREKEDHLPCDTRDFFDKDLFSELIRGVVEHYYEGIVGQNPSPCLFLGLPGLIESLIERMGVDEHMEEILRVEDQLTMSETDFALFLMERGIKETCQYSQGEKEIVLITGPHLGGFSQPISVPDLIEFLFCLSSLCVSDRYLMENALKTRGN